MRRRLLLLAVAALVAGCGDAGEDLLGERQAETLLTAVDDVERAVGADDCRAARRAAEAGGEAVAELPRRIDSQLKANLSDWFEHLESRVRRECEDPEPEETPTAEPTEEPTAEPTEEPTAEPTEEPTAEPTEEPTVEPPVDTGGSAAPEASTGNGNGDSEGNAGPLGLDGAGEDEA